jgi:hypothetical protein
LKGYEPYRRLPLSGLLSYLQGLGMQNLRYFQPFGLLVITYFEPFSAADLFAAARTADAPGRPDSRHRCALVDLRAVDLRIISSADSRRFVMARKEKVGAGPSEPVAFLIGKPEHYGTMRMNNQWLEAMGLRSESETTITESLVEALSWLGERTAQPDLATEMADLLTSDQRQKKCR